jgi:hypothetical protein
MRNPFHLLTSWLFISAVFYGCSEPSSSADDQPSHSGNSSLIALSASEVQQISEQFSQMIEAQSSGDWEKTLSYYYDGLFETDEQRNSTMELMANLHNNGYRQEFHNFKLLWASPFYESAGNDIALVAFEVEHTISLTDYMADRFESFETNVKDQYGKSSYTKDEANKRFHVNGPVKFFVLRSGNKPYQFMNEEVLRSPSTGRIIHSGPLQDMKNFESKARKALAG